MKIKGDIKIRKEKEESETKLTKDTIKLYKSFIENSDVASVNTKERLLQMAYFFGKFMSE